MAKDGHYPKTAHLDLDLDPASAQGRHEASVLLLSKSSPALGPLLPSSTIGVGVGSGFMYSGSAIATNYTTCTKQVLLRIFLHVFALFRTIRGGLLVFGGPLATRIVVPQSLNTLLPTPLSSERQFGDTLHYWPTGPILKHTDKGSMDVADPCASPAVDVLPCRFPQGSERSFS